MKVWLDDVRDPNNPFFHEHKGAEYGMVWVKTVEEAIALLETGEVTEISLDNDLGSGYREGREVAKWIEENAYNGKLKPLSARVHSDNIVAKREMRSAIYNARRYWNLI